ncbi:J domain-containing protein [Oscillatoria salina]|uniref:J domain-containing protein n=1 Tax=Oscillatoria salina TaxID=331517 RepID=UPI0013B83E7D|nr:DnaJ domain-containing protein [Oscillatoria salina]MBZ8183198.1 J domain-containing protein [Oscillatoria salina IIICB1]NET91065.1 J domain-containing protein [Kamptonema sp. SIO1D9]
MSDSNHYQTLGVSSKATQAEIKAAFRHLAKQCHPDIHSGKSNHERSVKLNAAYEVLRDPQRRRTYDQQIFYGYSAQTSAKRQQRTTEAQNRYRQQCQAEKEEDARLERWWREIYRPVYRLICLIINPLDAQIDDLSADPFDDLLMADFQQYLEDCRYHLNQAQLTFSSQPNPAQVASVAAHLYYCLDRLEDGINELEWFTNNYDEHYLHTGKELFRIASGLRRQAQYAAKAVV